MIVRAEVPGIKPDEIEVKVEGGPLTIDLLEVRIAIREELAAEAVTITPAAKG